MENKKFGLEIKREYGAGDYTIFEYHIVEERDGKFVSLGFALQSELKQLSSPYPLSQDLFCAYGQSEERELSQDYINSGKIVSVRDTPILDEF